MKNLIKYLVILLFIVVNTPLQLISGAINDMQIEKLGNFLDNAFANMTDEEKDLFMQEVQREQDKLMAMTPEERSAREEQVARELDQLMNNSPYGEWFEKPATSLMPEPVIPIEEAPKIEHTPKTTTPLKDKPKPKTVIVSKDLKQQYKQIVQNIVQAIDSLLLKTNNMQHIQHTSWNDQKWHHLKRDLNALKSQLQMIVNSEKTLAELASPEQKELVLSLQNFEKLITNNTSQIKTPDAMGLVVIFEEKPKIIDQERYDNAVIKLKTLIDDLAKNLNSSKLVSKIQNLLQKHAPTTVSKPIDDTKLAKKTVKADIACKANPDKALILKEIKELTTEIKRCINQQLLDLVNHYQNNSSNSLKRKLQWKLSELELNMHKLTKNIELTANCRSEVDLILNQVLQDFTIIDELVISLNQINASHELKNLIKQINQHSLIIKF